MALFDAIDALVEHWSDVRLRMSDRAWNRLTRLVDEMTTGSQDPGDLADLAAEVANLLARELDADHPVRRARARTGTRFGSGAARPWPDLVRRLELRMAPGAPAAPAPEEEWLLSADSLGRDDIAHHGHGPPDPDLILLDRPDGGVQFPAFQFGADGRPIPLVLRINRLLDVQDDPWGVADWWLGPNTWLDAAPADLLGRADDRELLSAAHAVSAEL
ncbi:hypothetical protein E1264_31675 [Actinomadura sp. KC216]|uniref:hypothetical protein n=1 Tax=Actinomadura sp. KC216 TaxID=2530370 RepID=UPI001044339F|nr:hypothetical protein [Actinomadura sp. KC216]TDB82202.1 hypothetical protein E1264_31675 [Actinomadura sp. KC216]